MLEGGIGIGLQAADKPISSRNGSNHFQLVQDCNISVSSIYETATRLQTEEDMPLPTYHHAAAETPAF